MVALASLLITLLATLEAQALYKYGGSVDLSAGVADNDFDRQFLDNLLPPKEIARFAEETIIQRRGMIREVIRDGLPALRIPSLDPVSVGQVPVNFTMDIVTLEGNISSLEAAGLSDLQLVGVQMQLPGMLLQLDVRVPKLVVNGTYFLDGEFIFPLKGSGPLALTLENVDVRLVSQLRLYYDRLHIARVDFTVNIERSSVKLIRFLDDAGFGDLAQQFLEDMSGDFLRTAVTRFRENQFPSVIMRANNFLRTFHWRTYLPNAIAIYLGFDSDLIVRPSEIYPSTIVDGGLVRRIVRRFAENSRTRSYAIPNLELLSRKKFFKWTLNSGVRLLPGKLYGLGSTTTVGDVLISRQHHRFTFNMDVAAYNLKVVFPSELLMLNKQTHFHTLVRISRAKINVQLQLDGQYMTLRLLALHILHIGNIQVKLSGLGALQRFARSLAEYQLNMEQSKQLMARQAAKIVGESLARTIGRVDLNAILTNTVNGQVYAVDPGIVFPDPVRNSSVSFSSILSSVLGVEGGNSSNTADLLSILLGGGDSDVDENQKMEDVDEDVLAAFGLTSEQIGNEKTEDVDDVDEDILAAFGLAQPETDPQQPTSTSDSSETNTSSGIQDDFIAGLDPEVLAAFGISEPPQVSQQTNSRNSVEVPVVVQATPTDQNVQPQNTDRNLSNDILDARSAVNDAVTLEGDAVSNNISPSSLNGIDADVLAAFGLS